MEKEILLNNGVKICILGFGTFLTPDGATCVEAVSLPSLQATPTSTLLLLIKMRRAWARESRKVESSVRISFNVPARFGTRSAWLLTRP